MSIRTIAEAAGRNIVFERSLSKRFSSVKILVSPDGGLRYWRANVEKTDPTLLSAVEYLVKPGAVVWDIGANVGLFSLAAAALAGRRGTVVSVDADVWLTNLVARSIKLNSERVAPIHQVTAAISDSEGFAEFHIAKRARSCSYLAGFGASQTGGSREVRTVPATTLDRLSERFPLPNVLKIDVEGAECLVLEGGRKMLAAARPAIFCEVAGENSAAVTRLLVQDLGYRLYDVSDSFDQPRVVQNAVWNTLALAA